MTEIPSFRRKIKCYYCILAERERENDIFAVEQNVNYILL